MKKILLPIDFSDVSEHARDYAVGFARDIGADIHLLHIFFDPIMDSDLPDYGMLRPLDQTDSVLRLPAIHAEEELEQARVKIQETLGSCGKVSAEMTKGLPQEEILFTANRCGASLILMGTRNTSKVYKTFFGSVTAKVIEKATIPVLAIPQDANYRGIRQVLYLSDFDKDDVRHLKSTFRLLSPLGPEVCSLYIFDDRGRAFTTEDYEDLRKVLDEHIHEDYPEEKVRVEVQGEKDVLDGIAKHLQEQPTDLIVASTHRRSFITRLTDPSVTKRILFHTHLPLMVFHDR